MVAYNVEEIYQKYDITALLFLFRSVRKLDQIRYTQQQFSLIFNLLHRIKTHDQIRHTAELKSL